MRLITCARYGREGHVPHEEEESGDEPRILPEESNFRLPTKKRVRPTESNESALSEPVTDLIAYPAESPPSAAAALTGLRISLFSGELSRRSTGRSWRPEIRFPPSPIDPIGLAQAVNDDEDGAVLNWRWIALIGRLSCGTPVTVAVARSSTRDSISRLIQWFSTMSCDSEREGSEVWGRRVFQV